MASIKITNLKAFNAEMKLAMKQSLEKQANILVKVSMDGLNALQRTTPHKTGRARAGWNNTVDAPPSEWKPKIGKEYYPLTPFKDQQRIGPYSIINLSNNVEYIVPLDEGHSRQNKHMVNKMFGGLTAQLMKMTAKESRRRVK